MLFNSRLMANQVVVTHRNMWWRGWSKGDSTSVARLAVLPFKGEKIFGESLDPHLAEDDDKCKVLPSHKKDTQTKKPRPFCSPGSTFRPKDSNQRSKNRWNRARFIPK